MSPNSEFFLRTLTVREASLPTSNSCCVPLSPPSQEQDQGQSQRPADREIRGHHCREQALQGSSAEHMTPSTISL